MRLAEPATASASEARNASFSPMATTSGEPARAPTTTSGLSRANTAIA